MTDDWASQFRPDNELEEEPKEIDSKEVYLPDESTIAEPQSMNFYEEAYGALIDNLLERVTRLEQLILNPPWLNDLNSNLQAVLRDNAAALVGANNQFMAVLARKMDEMEERLSSDDPSYTNILYSNPELFTEISQRPDENEITNGNELTAEEEFTSKSKIADLVDEEYPDLLEDETPEEDAVKVAFEQWQGKEIKWSDFVKVAGGVKAASAYKKQHS